MMENLVENRGMTCQWKHCQLKFNNIKQFIEHAKTHNRTTEIRKPMAVVGNKRAIPRNLTAIQYRQLQMQRNVKPSFPNEHKMVKCHWKTCGLIFKGMEEYIAHARGTHMIEVVHPTHRRSVSQSIAFENNRPINCEWKDCGMHFKTLDGCLRHVKSSHLTEERPIVCQWYNCDSKPTTRSNLASHLLKHIPVIKDICPKCFKKFKWKSDYRKHERQHILNTLPKDTQQNTSGNTTPDRSNTSTPELLPRKPENLEAKNIDDEIADIIIEDRPAYKAHLDNNLHEDEESAESGEITYEHMVHPNQNFEEKQMEQTLEYYEHMDERPDHLSDKSSEFSDMNANPDHLSEDNNNMEE